jgi:hypothetical protein
MRKHRLIERQQGELFALQHCPLMLLPVRRFSFFLDLNGKSRRRRTPTQNDKKCETPFELQMVLMFDANAN